MPDPSNGEYHRPSALRKVSIIRNQQEKSASFEEGETQPQPVRAGPGQAFSPGAAGNTYQEPAFREHVTGSLVVPPSEAPQFRPVYPPQQGARIAPLPAAPGQPLPARPVPAPLPPYYGAQPVAAVQQWRAGQQSYGGQNSYAYPPVLNGYYHPGGHYGYPVYPQYGWQPAKPKRDAYQLTISIIAFIASLLILLAGLANLLLLILVAAIGPNTALGIHKEFAAIAQLASFAGAGLVGGGFCLYHSMRVLFFQRKSIPFKLPWFWLFAILYLIVITISGALQYSGNAVMSLPLTLFLIVLAGILPATTFLALAVRRIHFPRNAEWPTTWRRFILALTSGATLAIFLALIFELVLTLVAVLQFGINRVALDNPDQPIPSDPKAIVFLFILVSGIAPLVEESVKPLAVVAMVGRIRSAAEAFILGMAAGVGFDLVETIGYISSGYDHWLNIALQRSSAGLLHGFGAGMVALGWYYATHANSTGKMNRALVTLVCWTYAILQHAIWNGSFGLQLLPAPIGPYLDNGTIVLGTITVPSFMLVYIVETILMLIFFLFITKKLRTRPAEPISPAINKG